MCDNKLAHISLDRPFIISYGIMILADFYENMFVIASPS